MTIECLGETVMSLKDQIDHSQKERDQGQETTRGGITQLESV